MKDKLERFWKELSWPSLSMKITNSKFIVIYFVPYFIYRATQKSVNCLIKSTPKYDRNFFITY
jgi:hypothetical protein